MDSRCCSTHYKIQVSIQHGGLCGPACHWPQGPDPYQSCTDGWAGAGSLWLLWRSMASTVIQGRETTKKKISSNVWTKLSSMSWTWTDSYSRLKPNSQDTRWLLFPSLCQAEEVSFCHSQCQASHGVHSRYTHRLLRRLSLFVFMKSTSNSFVLLWNKYLFFIPVSKVLELWMSVTSCHRAPRAL